MSMQATSTPTIDLDDFLELVIMWHCAGDIPMDMGQTIEFIERSEFTQFLESVDLWADKMGVQRPSRTEVVKTLHTLY